MRCVSERGVSIIEILLAMSLASVVMLSIAPLLMMGIQVSGASREATDVLLVASEQMEFLRSLPFSDTALASGGSIVASVADYSIDPLPGEPDRYLRWEVVDVSLHLKQIKLVGGSRIEVIGPPREVHIETFRTDLR